MLCSVFLEPYAFVQMVASESKGKGILLPVVRTLFVISLFDGV